MVIAAWEVVRLFLRAREAYAVDLRRKHANCLQAGTTGRQWLRIGNQINAAFVFARSDFVNVCELSPSFHGHTDKLPRGSFLKNQGLSPIGSRAASIAILGSNREPQNRDFLDSKITWSARHTKGARMAAHRQSD
jgi:hypothetical protein